MWRVGSVACLSGLRGFGDAVSGAELSIDVFALSRSAFDGRGAVTLVWRSGVGLVRIAALFPGAPVGRPRVQLLGDRMAVAPQAVVGASQSGGRVPR